MLKAKLILLLSISFGLSSLRAQTATLVRESLAGIDTLSQVPALMEQHPDWQIDTLHYSYRDTVLLQELVDLKLGAFTSVSQGDADYIIKTIVAHTERQHRVSYIYLDGNSYDAEQIDSLRTIIIGGFYDGIAFDSLARIHSMDANAAHGGDLGWFNPETMVAPFSKAVRRAAYGDLFTVDVPDRNWYFVVLKTHRDRIKVYRCLVKVALQN